MYLSVKCQKRSFKKLFKSPSLALCERGGVLVMYEVVEGLEVWRPCEMWRLSCSSSHSSGVSQSQHNN